MLRPFGPDPCTVCGENPAPYDCDGCVWNRAVPKQCKTIDCCFHVEGGGCSLVQDTTCKASTAFKPTYWKRIQALHYICGNCGGEVPEPQNYCLQCGAGMDGVLWPGDTGYNT